MAKRKQPAPGFAPWLARDPASILSGSRLSLVYVLAETFCGVRVVQRQLSMPGVIGVVDRVVSQWQLPHYKPVTEISLQSALTDLKSEMLQHGATPEAVQLVGAVAPFEEKELKIMTEKLKSKPAPAAKKPAAAAKPKGDSPIKARPDQKYKTMMTQKQAAEKTRPDSWTARMVEIALNNKSTDAAKAELAGDKTYGDKRMDFSWLEKKGFIKLDA